MVNPLTPLYDPFGTLEDGYNQPYTKPEKAMPHTSIKTGGTETMPTASIKTGGTETMPTASIKTGGTETMPAPKGGTTDTAAEPVEKPPDTPDTGGTNGDDAIEFVLFIVVSTIAISAVAIICDQILNKEDRDTESRLSNLQGLSQSNLNKEEQTSQKVNRVAANTQSKVGVRI